MYIEIYRFNHLTCIAHVFFRLRKRVKRQLRLVNTMVIVTVLAKVQDRRCSCPRHWMNHKSPGWLRQLSN